MDFKEYIMPGLLVLIPALFGLGVIFKNTSRIKDEDIPLTLLIISLFLAACFVLGTNPIPDVQSAATAIFTSLTQGALCAAGAVFAHQVHIQKMKGE